MDLRLISRVLFLRAAWRRRDHWDAAQITANQDNALHELRRATYAGSEFYRRHHAGLHDAPLDQLPPVTKADLMAHFDEAFTTPDLSLADLENHLRSLTQSGSRVPTHQSAVVGASLRSGLVPTLRLDVTAPMDETVAALNRFQPRILVGYASALKPLAGEQTAGRLRISPEGVMSSSEVLSPHTASELETAWGSAPFDVYAATETAGIASPCTYRNRHVYEDLLIIEPVDQNGNPVPAGTTGAKLLVTVLFSRTLPLIRYEMSDTVRLGGRGCPCGRSFTVLEDIEGRIEDVLQLPGKAGDVSVHPIVFHHVLDQAAASGWQIIQEASGLRVLLAGLAPGASPEGVRTAVACALKEIGVVDTAVDVHVVERVERTALGKAPFVRGLMGRR